MTEPTVTVDKASSRIPEPGRSKALGRQAVPRGLSPKGFLPELRLFGIPIHRRSALLLLGDLCVLVLSTYLGHQFRWLTEGEIRGLYEILQRFTGASLLFAGCVLLALYLLDCYSSQLDFRSPAALFRLALAVGAAALLQMAAYYLLPSWRWFRGETILSLYVLLPTLLAWRAAASALLTRRLGPAPVLIVGSPPGAGSLAQVLDNPRLYGHGYKLVGFVSDDPADEDSSKGPVLGSARELVEIVHQHGIREIVVAYREELSPEMASSLLALKQLGLSITNLPAAYRRLTGKVPVAELSDSWVIFGPDFRGVKPLYGGAIRLADLAIAAVGLIFGTPVVLLAAVAIKMTSKGPVFFIQKRAGLNERPFNLIKLRTMKDKAEQETGPVWSSGRSDTRVTPLGRFLRRSRIDELPQLWNVMRGEMSIVGPRPERPEFVSQLKERIPYYSLRFAVRPGLTGWAQVKYPYGASEQDALEKLQYDLYAIQEMSPMLYFVILLKTLQTILMRPGS